MVHDMAGDAPDLDEFDQPDLRLSPKLHQVQAEMAAERGEDYDPYEFEERIDETPDPHLIEDAEPVEGQEHLYKEWVDAGE